MQKLWTICLSLMMGISFVASYPAALVEAPAMKTPDESLEAIKAKAFMDPLDQLVQSFPDDFNTCTQPQETAQPSSSEPDAPASEASSPDSSSQEAASSEPAEPAEASGDPSEPAIPANSDNAIELSEFYIPEIPLSQELQAYTYQQCQEKQVSYELVLAMMYHESNYDPSAVMRMALLTAGLCRLTASILNLYMSFMGSLIFRILMKIFWQASVLFPALSINTANMTA